MLASLERPRFSGAVVHEAVVFLEDVRAVADRRDVEDIPKLASQPDRLLPRDDVTEFMADHARQFILALGESDELAGDIHVSARQGVCVGVRELDQRELEAKLGWRKMPDQTLAHPPEIGHNRLVVNRPEAGRDVFDDRVAGVIFLRFGENIWLARRWRARRAARLLSDGRTSRSDSSEQEQT